MSDAWRYVIFSTNCDFVYNIYLGFGVAFFQVPWAEEHGALQVYGVEAA
jgi:hypothetical protein